MPLAPYHYTGPIDHNVAPDLTQMKGKSVIITGGANGIGEAMVRAFAAAGAFVTFGDLNPRGMEIEKELNDAEAKCIFVKADVRSWEDQVRMFATAKAKSPSRSVDVVIANAGISRSSGDSLWVLDDPNGEASKPALNIVDVNLVGTFYSWKLAVHYFRKQPDVDERDRCFIITGSMVAWIDSPGNWEYTATKYALRGFMRTARRNSWQQSIRINYVAPCWIRSAIRSKEYEAWLVEQGIEFGEQEDCAGCMMRIACDKTINGRSLMIVPRSQTQAGYIDVDMDDHKEDGYFKKLQDSQLTIIKDQWIEK